MKPVFKYFDKTIFLQIWYLNANSIKYFASELIAKRRSLIMSLQLVMTAQTASFWYELAFKDDI